MPRYIRIAPDRVDPWDLPLWLVLREAHSANDANRDHVMGRLPPGIQHPGILQAADMAWNDWHSRIEAARERGTGLPEIIRQLVPYRAISHLAPEYEARIGDPFGELRLGRHCVYVDPYERIWHDQAWTLVERPRQPSEWLAESYALTEELRRQEGRPPFNMFGDLGRQWERHARRWRGERTIYDRAMERHMRRRRKAEAGTLPG